MTERRIGYYWTCRGSRHRQIQASTTNKARNDQQAKGLVASAHPPKEAAALSCKVLRHSSPAGGGHEVCIRGGVRALDVAQAAHEPLDGWHLAALECLELLPCIAQRRLMPCTSALSMPSQRFPWSVGTAKICMQGLHTTRCQNACPAALVTSACIGRSILNR